jgi:hypothetical protein
MPMRPLTFTLRLHRAWLLCAIALALAALACATFRAPGEPAPTRPPTASPAKPTFTATATPTVTATPSPTRTITPTRTATLRLSATPFVSRPRQSTATPTPSPVS